MPCYTFDPCAKHVCTHFEYVIYIPGYNSLDCRLLDILRTVFAVYLFSKCLAWVSSLEILLVRMFLVLGILSQSASRFHCFRCMICIGGNLMVCYELYVA